MSITLKNAYLYENLALQVYYSFKISIQWAQEYFKHYVMNERQYGSWFQKLASLGEPKFYNLLHYEGKDIIGSIVSPSSSQIFFHLRMLSLWKSPFSLVHWGRVTMNQVGHVRVGGSDCTWRRSNGRAGRRSMFGWRVQLLYQGGHYNLMVKVTNRQCGGAV